MNHWIPPHIKEQFSKIEEYQANKKHEAEVLSYIENLPSPNYVLIDAALWGTDIDAFLDNLTIIYKSLFRGSTGLELWSVAPYLIDVSTNEEFVETIRKKDPIERRVTWLHSTENIESLRKHLRKFLRMKQEDGSYIYFRFYDPYVVNAVFPNFTKEQAMEFFEKIEFIATEDVRFNEKRIFYQSPEQGLQNISQKLD